MDRIRTRKYRILKSNSLTKSQQRYVDLCPEYGLYSYNGNEPQVLLFGINHVTQIPLDKDDFVSCLEKIVEDGDVITSEGSNGDVDIENPKDKLSKQIVSSLKDKNFRLVYNDDMRIVIQSLVLTSNVRNEKDQSIVEQAYKEHFEKCDIRDYKFCYGKRGIVNMLNEPGVNKVIQWVGTAHLSYGQIEKYLKAEGISYMMFIHKPLTRTNLLNEITDFKDMKFIKNEWIALIDELGYVGKRKICEELDERFGTFNWARAFIYDGQIIRKERMLELYEEGYFHFLSNNKNLLEWLVLTASEVYDNAESNVNSGLDYSIQECNSVHFQDIAVRNVLKRLGKKFKGDHLVEIRGYESEGYVLNPGKVPFYEFHKIIESSVKSWWDKGSIEDLYQSNKVLMVNPDNLFVAPVIIGPEGIYFAHTKQSYYLPTKGNNKRLMHKSGRAVRRLMHESKGVYKKFDKLEPKPYSYWLGEGKSKIDKLLLY